jgi:hypothetical protein
MGVNEPILPGYMESLFPRRVPTLIASEPRYGWMIMGDFGKTLRGESPIELKEEVLRVFGSIQLESTRYVDKFLKLGCTDRRPYHVTARIESLLADEIVISKLTVEEINELQRQVPRVVNMCERLAEYSVPFTLVHGDIHLGNVSSFEGKLITSIGRMLVSPILSWIYFNL